MSKKLSQTAKIKIYNTSWQKGADVDDRCHEDLPVTSIDLKDISGLEPDVKMNSPESALRTTEMIQLIQEPESRLPPILVRHHGNGYQVVDGHHRFYAYRQLGKTIIPAKIVPEERIVEIRKEPLLRVPVLIAKKALRRILKR